jgi:hypothetical protein
MGTIVFLYILIGSCGVIFPGLVEGMLGIKYNFQDIWGLSRTQVETFTIGTIAIDLFVGLVGFALARNVRKNISNSSEI